RNDVHPSIFSQRIQALRSAMAIRAIDACVILSSDPHLSEYLPERWQGRQWLSGFDGSAGTLLVTADFSGLWTDSRYWEQAGNALAGTGIEVMRAGAPDVPPPAGWLADTLPAGSRVNIDGKVLAVQAHRQWQKTL